MMRLARYAALALLLGCSSDPTLDGEEAFADSGTAESTSDGAPGSDSMPPSDGSPDSGSSGEARSLVWYGASTTVFAGSTSNSSPQAGYSVPALVADFYEKWSGATGPAPKVWAAGGTPLSTWRRAAAWSDATSGNYDVVIATAVRLVTPAVSPPGETNELIAANAELTGSDFVAWAPVQPQRSGAALASYFSCAQENAELGGHELHVPPVAQAMQAARDAGFTLNNGDADGGLNPHYTRAGAYLVAATIFAHIYNASPVGIEPEHVYLGICANPANRERVQCAMTGAEAATLQEIAHDAVMANQVVASCNEFCADLTSNEPICN